ncbi:MAG: murein biosynthesis integral membrane protein MurJ [Deltaproteobacteria bacterium]
MSEHRSILKSASVISGFTMVSRATGFIRDMLMAGLFGTGAEIQAFFVAFRIPNMLRDIMGEGAGNAAFVPVFCEVLQQRPRREFLDLVHRLFFLVTAVSLAAAALGIVFSPFIVRLVAPGFLGDPFKFSLSVALNRILFPYLLFVTLSAFLMSVANAMKSFAAPAATSVAFNLVMIAGLASLGWADGGRIQILALAVLLGGIVQVLIQLPSLARRGVTFSVRRPRGVLRDPVIRRIGRLMAPRIVGTSVYQLNVFIDTIVASLSAAVGDGGVAAVYFANRLVYLPFSLFGVSVSNAALPNLSAHAAARDEEAFRALTAFCLRVVFLGAAPFFVAFLVLSRPLVEAVFERGSFGAYSTGITATAVAFYGAGLLSYAGARILSSAFYALQDTRTPVKSAALGLTVNVILIAAFVFWQRWGIAGLALSSALGATANVAWLVHALRRRIRFSLGAALRGILTPVVAAAGAMGLAVHAFWYYGPALGVSLVKMLATTALGAAVYVGALRVARVHEIEDVIRWVLRKK